MNSFAAELYGTADVDGDRREEVFMPVGGGSVAVLTILTMVGDQLIQVREQGTAFEFQVGDSNPGSSGAICKDKRLHLLDYDRDQRDAWFSDSGSLTVTIYDIERASAVSVSSKTRRVESKPEGAGDLRCGDVPFLGS